ncbi:YcaO-like family protein [Nonomuraea sp. NPDC005650]|uniref:YcaO-like family protein n=1 Tax=Nonomuraea sp. NPDC005650 TaxID=3157045 RepID=UPI0033A33300
MPDPTKPDHATPDHATPDHAAPDHTTPDHPLPDRAILTGVPDLWRPARRPELADRLVSRRTGPVIRVEETAPEQGGAWRVAVAGASVDRVHPAVRPATGGSRAPSRDEARRKAFSEFAERLVLQEPPYPTGSPASDGDCPLTTMPLHVRELATGDTRVHPAAGYYLHPASCPLAGRSDRPSSNGAAAGESYWQAVERGLLELLERDALMTTWRYGLRPPRLSPAGFADDETEELLRRGFRLSLVNLSAAHGIPTVVCLLRGRVDGRADGQAVATVGSAADRTLSRAVARAAGEAVSVLEACAHHLASGPSGELALDDFVEHAFHYLDPGRIGLLDRLDSATAVDSEAPELAGDSRTLVEEIAAGLAAREISVYAADLTPPWLAAMGTRTVVTRSPDLYPLELGHGSPALAGRLARHASRRALVDATRVHLEPVPLA